MLCKRANTGKFCANTSKAIFVQIGANDRAICTQKLHLYKW